MILQTLLLALGAAVLVEAACMILMPTLWSRARFVVQPFLGAGIGASVPAGLMIETPWFDLWLSALLAALVASLVAVGGLFNQRFFLGPSENDVRSSGMRSTFARR